MSRIAIIAAMEREVKPLIRNWSVRTLEHGGRQYRLFENGDAVLICGGIGAEAARRAAEAVIQETRPVRVLSVGFAGALDSTLKAPDVFEPRTVINVADGVRSETGSGQGTLVSYAVVAGREQKQRLATAYKAAAVDMEAAAVAEGAQARGVEFAALKAISDASDFAVPAMERFVASDGQFRTVKFAMHVAARPWLWGSTIALARNSATASRALCAAIEEYLKRETFALELNQKQNRPELVGGHTLEKQSSVMAIGRTLAVENEVRAIPSTMKAAVYRGVNDVRLEEVPVPEVGWREILVRVHTCGICGTDLKKISTGSHSAPRIFGHETSGVVAKVGEGVREFAVGDRVVVFHHIPCRECYYCRHKTFAQCATYKKVGCTAGFEPSGGGFAEYVRVMDWIVQKGTVRIPDGVTFEQACFVEPINTCIKGIETLRLEPGETVLVIGQGPIGLILAVLAKRAGARVITSDLYPARLTISRSFGLDLTIDASQAQAEPAVRGMTEGRGADAVILAVGGSGLIRPAMDATRPGGRVLLFAQTSRGEATIDPAAVCVEEKALLGSYSASVELQQESVRFVMNREMDLERLISHRFPLESSVEALKLAAHPQPDSMKIVIQPGSAWAPSMPGLA